MKETYIFDNYPVKILGHNHSSQEKSAAYNEYCLWNYIEPNYYKTDSLHYLYSTEKKRYKLGLNVKKLNYLIFIEEESLWDKIKDSLLSSFKRDVILEDDKVYFLYQKLLLLDNFLENGEQVHRCLL